ncbi:M23 family metallopeptidase [Microbacterium sp. BK668]|uniref:murein hydrolase activator EnvC family protein n=1 Tax=Microbacterium sp. BK668 TaxID=2512118 RepID=UPI0010D90E79|nr:M23 family metallopeptidase [Microbacterium sp. BK668]TDN92706.1 peptidase M23-like protein [Microbacterium sp. BK668]
MSRLPLPARLMATVAVACAAVACAAIAAAPGASARGQSPSGVDWTWPVSPFRIVEPYVQPAHRYAPGHRGIDLRPMDDTLVVAPADGVVAFSGVVADRSLVTIDHGDGLVTTLEPVSSRLEPGAAVHHGEPIGEVGAGGHAAPGTLHFGVRRNGEYINPLLLLGGVPRAVLLPCCS